MSRESAEREGRRKRDIVENGGGGPSSYPPNFKFQLPDTCLTSETISKILSYLCYRDCGHRDPSSSPNRQTCPPHWSPSCHLPQASWQPKLPSSIIPGTHCCADSLQSPARARPFEKPRSGQKTCPRSGLRLSPTQASVNMLSIPPRHRNQRHAGPLVMPNP